jgi:general L-amino acid transport system permease protein
LTQPPSILSSEHHAPVPVWRDIRVLRWLFQIAVLIGVIALAVTLMQNLQQNLLRLGLQFGFDFLDARAGFQIGEGPAFDPNDTFLAAYAVGVVNTIRVAVLGVVLATVVGTLVGISRLSSNWLVRNVALVFVEIMQNTPLLVQLFFWYILIRALPAQDRDTVGRIPSQPIILGPIQVPTLIYYSQRAAVLPGLEMTPTFAFWWPFLVLGLVAAVVAWRIRVHLLDRQGLPPTGQFLWAIAAFLLVAGLGCVLMSGIPARLVIPVLSDKGIVVNYVGGWELSNSFQALIIGLVLYTGAFIAEVVRSGIQAVSYGQIEAAISLGLTPSQRLRLIILPQALRVIIPPLINQYLNLVKNSSLAIAVGYPDLYNVSQTIGNQSGQNIQVIVMIMATYLAMSLVVSFIMNFINRRIQITER